ncbi:MAG: nitroreductase family protein [Chloroflexi bacterium]|nr:nitroreductase family protein [Chloroflexota bacterium]
MQKPADTQYAIHDLLKSRWSPRAFSSQPVKAEDLGSLFEAARWSPSAGNSQPWSFVVASQTNNEAVHQKFVGTMRGRNAAWTKNVPVLVLAVVKLNAEMPAMNRFAYYDVGQAVAHLTTQASALGLYVHQMAGFDGEQIRQIFEIPAGYEPITAIAIGYFGDLDDLPPDLREREVQERTRKNFPEFIFSERWNQPLTLEKAEVLADI